MRANPATLIGLFTAEQHRLAGSHYNPNQPRAPQGTAIGGRWIASGQTADPARRARPTDGQMALDLDALPGTDAGLDEPGMREAEAARQALLASDAERERRIADLEAQIKTLDKQAHDAAQILAKAPLDADFEAPEYVNADAAWKDAVRQLDKLFNKKHRLQQAQITNAMK